MDPGEIDAAVEQVREIPDDAERLVQSHRLIQEFKRGVSDLMDVQQAAGQRLRAAGWTFKRLGVAVGEPAARAAAVGQAIVRRSRKKRERD